MLRLSILILVTMLILINGYGQAEKKLPKSLTRKVKQLTHNSTSEIEKFENICRWICKHKHYDVRRFQSLSFEDKYSLKKIWKNKKLLCSEYADLLNAMCKAAKIKCYATEGYTKSIGHYPYKKFYYHDHMWNVAWLDSNYQIIDLTWASGYLKPKSSIIGTIKIALKLPYIPRRWKYIHQLNPYYLSIPPDSLTKTHIPILPMWQLTPNPISIEEFEKEQFSKSSNSPGINFYEKINHYSNQEYSDKLLIEAKEGYDFNRKNNLVKGIKFWEYSGLKWMEIKKDKSTDMGKINQAKVVKEYSTEAEKYLRKFLRDNNLIQKEVKDSLTFKNREVTKFINKSFRHVDRKYKEINLKIRTNTRKNQLTKLTIVKQKVDRNKKTSNEIIYRVTRPKKDKFDKKSIDSIRTEIDSINNKINNNISILNEYKNAINIYTTNRSIIFDSLLLISKYTNKLLNLTNSINLNTNNIHILNKLHSIADTLFIIQLQLQKQFKDIERFYDLNFTNKKDSLINVSMKLIASNKKKIIQLKKSCIKNQEEEQLFIGENELLKDLYTLNISYLHYEINRKNEYNHFFKQWSDKVLINNKLLKRYRRTEKYLYLNHLKLERARHSSYQRVARRGIIQCNLLKRKSNILIQTFTKHKK